MGSVYSGRRGGFTLIELSIVLVIIGLIVGGVLVGRSLIRTAELRSIITDKEKYITAVNTFRTKYDNQLPGDMANATTYWGTDTTNCPGGTNAVDNVTYTTPQIITCNGNGNGFIENDETGESSSAPDQKFENFRAWEQLANAKLIPGAYTGTPGPASWDDNEPGLNVPPTRITNGGFEWTMFNASSRNSPSIWNASLNTQYLLVGSPGNGGYDLTNALISPGDAQGIDMKIDDGKPDGGSYLAADGIGTSPVCGGPQCVGACLVETWPGPVITYGASAAPGCSMLFRVGSW